MRAFSTAELAYLQANGGLPAWPPSAPTAPRTSPRSACGAWTAPGGVVEVTGHDFAATKKFRDVARTGRAAIVVDDVLPPWRPRGVEIRGRAEALSHPQPRIRIHPERIVAWAWTTPPPQRPHRPPITERGPIPDHESWSPAPCCSDLTACLRNRHSTGVSTFA
jgi:pyridoxamine 5'-phosphate oxidase family protein